MGFLESIGYYVDTPDAYLRGLLAGKPFERASGQDVLESWGLLDEGPDAPLLSARGAAGFGVEALASLYNVLPGFGVGTKIGKAATKIVPHIDDAARAVKALDKATEVAKTAKPKQVFDLWQGARVIDPAADALRTAQGKVDDLSKIFGGSVQDATGALKSEDELLKMLSAQPGKLGADARSIVQAGAPLRTKTAGDAVDAGHRALFQVGGEFKPLPLLPGINLPQKTLIKGKGAVEKIDKFTNFLGNNRVVAPIKALFERTPIDEAARDTILDQQAAANQLRKGVADFDTQIDELTSATAATLHKGGMDAFRATDEANLLLKGKSPKTKEQILSAITEGLEGGTSPDELSHLVNGLRNRYDEIAKFETDYAGLVPIAGDYAPHLVTKKGRGFFSKLTPDKKAGIQRAINNLRESRGLDPIQQGTGAAPTMARRLEQMDQNLIGELDGIGLTEEFLSETLHGSMRGRQYSGVGISDLNKIMKQVGGASADVFETNPIKQLYVRELRHLKVKGAKEFMDRLKGSGIASDAGKAISRGSSGIPGVSEVTLENGLRGFGIESEGGSLVFKTADEAKSAKKAMEMLSDESEAGPLLDFYDKMTRIWKSYLTRPFPAYHIRNRFSNRIQAYLEDVPVMGRHYKLANKLVAGDDFILDTPLGKLTRDQVEELGKRHGVDQGFFSGLEDEVDEVFKDRNATWSPFSPHSKFITGPEKVSAGMTGAIGQTLSGNMKNVTKLDSSAIENVDRYGVFIHKLQEGFSPAEAAKAVNKSLFDYSRKSMNNFERNVMNRAVMFYGYTRSVIPFILEKAFTEPRKLKPWLQLTQDPGTPETQPQWLQERIGLSLGEDEAGREKVLTGLGTPMEAALEPFSGFQEGFGRGFAKLATNLNPMLKVPMELAFEEDLFLGRDIEDLRKAPHYFDNLPEAVQDPLGIVTNEVGGKPRTEADPWLLYGLRNMPLSRVSNTISRATDETKDVKDALLNLFTGARVVSIDEQREKRWRDRNATIERLKDMQRQGKVYQLQNMFAPTTEGKEDPMVKALLGQLRQ